MTPERWRRIEQLFVEAWALDREGRGAFLAAECGLDAELRVEVAALLAAADAADDPLRRAIDQAAAELASTTALAHVGRRLGCYRLLDVIGEGGMGTVYLAERDDAQYRHRVAIKVLRVGVSSRAQIARLRDERQLLATLQHPGIVRLLDGGSTDEGLPFLVLEHVEGVPITSYARDLPVRARLDLVLRVAGALQYAHQRLVVHRDVKPSNILVDATGTPKLLDFGIAKLLDPAAGEPREAQTHTGMSMFTVEYASPEQARGEPVSVATDVYSLGAVLYHVLVGGPPQCAGATLTETLRNVCEREPARPGGVRRELAGDLDNILLKALAKSPERRYPSVAALADDLRRYLDGQPVIAREATLAYRARKLLARHRAAVALAGLVLGSLAGATIVSLRQARRASEQADLAEHETRTLLAERGRKELEDGRAARALPYFAEVLREGDDSTALRLSIAEAMRPLRAALATMDFPTGITGLEWSPDGSRIVVTAMNVDAALYDAAGTRVATLDAPTQQLIGPVFSSDGRSLATQTPGGRVFVWNAASGALRWSADAHAAVGPGAALAGLAFTPDGTRLVTAGSSDRNIVVWDAATGARLRAFEGVASGHRLWGLALSWDGAEIAASRDDGTIARWPLAGGSGIRQLVGHGRMDHIQYSRDGARIYGGTPESVTIWDVVRSAPIAQLVGQLAFDVSSDDTELATTGGDHTARVWDARDGTARAVMSTGRETLQVVRFSANGRRLVAGGDGIYRIWETHGTIPLAVLEVSPGSGAAPHSPSNMSAASFDPGGDHMLTASNVRATIWRVDRAPLLAEIRGPGDALVAAYSPDETRIAAGGMGWAGVWDRRDGSHRLAFDVGDAWVWDLSWTRDGSRLLVVGDHSLVRLYDRVGALVRTLSGHQGTVNRGSFSPDGARIITTGDDRTLRIWDAASGAQLRSLSHPDRVMAAAWSRDGRRIATAGWDHTLRIWGAESGQLLETLVDPGIGFLDVAFDASGRRLAASGHAGEVQIWDLGSAHKIVNLEGHVGPVTNVVWSPDGRLLATSSDDTTARLWDPETGSPLAVRTHPGGVMSVTWSRDCTRILTSCMDHSIYEWDVHRDDDPASAILDFIARAVPYRLVNGRLEPIMR